MGGGCPSFMPVLHIASGLPSCLPSSSLVVNFQPIGANFRQKVAKVNIYLLALVFSRDFWRPKRVKFKIYLSFEGAGLPLWLSLWGGGGVHRVQAVRSCSLSLGVFRPFALPLSLSCFACRVACEYGFISHFKGVFSAFWGADVCLYRLRSLRGLCGFCARVELGGLKACGVFASILSLSPMFYLFCIRFSSSSPIFEGFAFVILCLSSCLPCLFLCHCGVCVFFFPFGLYAKRKGAPCWCVLSCPVVGLFRCH